MKESQVNELVTTFKQPAPIFVTRPRLPDRALYENYLEQIWESHWLTNDGQFSVLLEKRLKRYLEVENINLFVNGTIALLVALQALRINSGEVITTPFTFPATTHVIYWNQVTPAFCDIDPKTLNIDPDKIEGLIRPDTRAILAVHVYGTPCDVEAIQTIADRHNLHVIYDAAHAFGVRINDKSILEYGDLSVLSFHATKLFTSIEGGALISQSRLLRDRIKFLLNFGIADEETVIGPGINGKMNEFQASFGLLTLETVDQEIADRRNLANIYREDLSSIPGLSCLDELPNVTHNYCYFPVLINPDEFGCHRNDLYALLKKCDFHPRKYFYPLTSSYPCYSSLPTATQENLPVATKVSNDILCLPLYGELPKEKILTLCDLIKAIQQCCA